jgi:hypothetical protein
MGKGKVHYIEVLSDEEDDGEDEVVHAHRIVDRAVVRQIHHTLRLQSRHSCRKVSRK